MWNNHQTADTTMTITSGYVTYANNADITWYGSDWPAPPPVSRLCYVPPHRLATAAAMRDKSARMHRRPRDEARRSPVLERRAWTTAPRRVL